MEDDREAELEAGRMPLLDHLVELRRRLMYAMIAFMVAFGACYYFSGSIYYFLAEPLARVLQQQGMAAPLGVVPLAVQVVSANVCAMVAPALVKAMAGLVLGNGEPVVGAPGLTGLVRPARPSRARGSA